MNVSKLRQAGLSQVMILSLGLAVLITISAASLYFVFKARDDAERVVHTVEVEAQISTVQLQLRRAESFERGYVITRRDADLAEFEQASTDVVPSIDALAKLTSDNPVQQKAMQQLIPLARERLDQMRQSIELARSAKIDAAFEVIRESADRNLMMRIREIAEGMRTEEQRLLVIRNAAVETSQRLAAIVTTAGSGLVVALAGFSMVLVRRASKERDLAEWQLRENNANLEATVDERTADLREANEEIQRFAYIVSHDLRSPLVNIMGFTSELDELRGDIFRRIASKAAVNNNTPPQKLDVGNEDPVLEGEDKKLHEDFTEALGFIKSSIGKMDRLIGAILNLTREGSRKFRPEQIDLNELMQGIVATVAHQASEANAEIRIEALPDITSDRLALEQIFSNLIDNALKYLKDGVPGEIVVRSRRKLGFALIDVTDNGRGIDAKDHQRIFDLFRRAGTQDKPGQGIGLAHVRALVRRLGGTLNVTSELHRGSTFTVTLPVNWTAEAKGHTS